MEQDRFDAFVKGLATRQSRRSALARWGAAAAAVVAGVAARQVPAGAQLLPCADDGCRCRTGALETCTPGLVCCADNPDLPGGSGTCTPPSQCFGGLCSGDAVVCPPTCSWGSNCLGCCSGFCGHDGLCSRGGCRIAGCDCITGTLAPCDDGLACCPVVDGLPGGPGICVPRGICD
jgi:hypothetical protein